MILLSTKGTVNPIAAQLNIAVIPGDGIGKEVIPEGIRVLEAAGKKHGIVFEWTEYDWSCQTYVQTGSMMPEDGLAQALSGLAVETHVIGDCLAPRTAEEAVFEGLKAGSAI